MINERAQYSVDEGTWPPDQPKEYTPLVLIQHQEWRTKEQDIEMAQLVQTGDIDSVACGQLAPIHRRRLQILQHILNTSTVTKKVAEILSPLEESNGQKFVLIEGAPGIGKSSFTKAYCIPMGTEIIIGNVQISVACLSSRSKHLAG